MATFTLQPLDGSGLLAASISSTSATITAITGVTGQNIRVYKIFLVVTATVTVKFQDGSTDLTGAMSLANNGAITLDLDGQPWFTCTRGNSFTIVQSSTTQVSGTVYYTVNQY